MYMRSSSTIQWRRSLLLPLCIGVLLHVQFCSIDLCLDPKIFVVEAKTVTSLSGFGSRSVSKTIFSKQFVVPTKARRKKKKSGQKAPLNNLPNSPSMWVRRHVHEPNALWIQVRNHHHHPSTIEKVNPIRTFRISASNNNKINNKKTNKKYGEDFQMEERPFPTTDNANLNQDIADQWIPVEGLYGYYTLPSGLLWIFITQSEAVYTAPPLALPDNDNRQSTWWQIRKVSNLELVRLGHDNSVQLSTAEWKEEVRQLRLLRNALKEHQFYFVPRIKGMIVSDMTKSLQKTFQAHLTNQDSTATDATTNMTLPNDSNHPSASSFHWWENTNNRPDPRFFWNQAAVDPLLERLNNVDANGITQHEWTEELLQHVLPLTSAFVGVKSNISSIQSGQQAPQHQIQYDQILISRRSRFRAGTRFTRRGADASGAVANFAETEQICFILDNNTSPTTTTTPYLDKILSHIQIRGSIPLRWSSPTDVKTYRPRVRIGTDPLAQARALRRHLLELFAHYVAGDNANETMTTHGSASKTSKLVFVNLIDKKKDQGRLGRVFDEVLKAVMEVYSWKNKSVPSRPNPLDDRSQSTTETTTSLWQREDKLLSDTNAVEHVWFDFHAEVKHGRWDRLLKLLNEVEPALLEHGYFWVDVPNYHTNNKTWTIRNTQKAVVRTNCMDCLDRTNVVQSLFGRYMLFQQLSDTCRLPTNSDITPTISPEIWEAHTQKYNKNPMIMPWLSGEKAHRILWADNADAISRLYAGTRALKGDFTRTGQRTKKGALDDGMNSLQRYYLNNFQDADRQEAIDLLVGYVQFSNVDISNQGESSRSLSLWDSNGESTSSTSRQDDETTMFSIREAARQAFFGSALPNARTSSPSKPELVPVGMVGGQSGYHRAGAHHYRMGSSIGSVVDLRWLPGDLQIQVLGHVEDLIQERKSSPDSNKENTGISSRATFSPIKALAAMDVRAESDLPWWVYPVNGHRSTMSTIPNKETPTASATHWEFPTEATVNDLAENVLQSQPAASLSVGQLLGLILLGYRAPDLLAKFVVTLLSLIFLPDIFQHDLEVLLENDETKEAN